MNALAVIAEPALPVVFEAELELASDFAKASKSAATLKAYRTDFSIFEAWCRGRGLNALLARCKAVVAFFAAQAGAGKPASTLQRRLAAIGYMHKIASVPSPIGAEAIKATLSGNPAFHRRRAGQEERRPQATCARHGGHRGRRISAAAARQDKPWLSSSRRVRGASGLMCRASGHTACAPGSSRAPSSAAVCKSPTVEMP
jgi:hypothetical protein